MKRVAIIVAITLLSVPASAQQPTNAVKVLSAEIAELAGLHAQCIEQSGLVQQQLAAAQARIRLLEDKYEPKPNPKPEGDKRR